MFANTKTSFKIGGSVGIIILLLGITLMFGVYQMSKVSNEIIQISEEYTPLYEIVSDIRFQKANQEAYIEKIIRFSDANNISELDNAKEEFWLRGTIIDSRIERAKNIVRAGLDVTPQLTSGNDLNAIMQKLTNLDKIHEQYVVDVNAFLLELDGGKFNDGMFQQIKRTESQIDFEIETILVNLAALTDKSTSQIENNERDSLTGQIVIVTIVGAIAATLGFFISQINNDLKKEVELKTSELKTANEKLQQLDKMKDEFIGIASHELKSPIQPILGFAELAKSGDIDQKEAWDGVLELGSKLQDLANAVLDVSRIESNRLNLQLEMVPINDLILDITKSQKINLKKPIVIKENLDENVRIQVDKVRIGQVIRNLLNNAVKFTQKGTVSIDTHVYKEENKIQVKISDTGSGIPADILPRVFDKFVTKGLKNEQQSGTGLGLFLCKGIIEAHGGRITAQNNFDEGASFEFTLPISNKIQNPPELSTN